jgi:hypothetical protein
MQGSSTNIYSGRNSIDPVASRTRPFLVCFLFAFATPFALALLEPIVIGMATKGAGATSIDRRRRAHNMLDSACADPGYALRWCEQARTDGDMKEARLLLRSALGCSKVADYASIYKAWIAMELRAGNVDAARGLFHEWGSRIYAGEDDSGVNFWCMFINFEVWNGGADRTRAVARAAAEACPSHYGKNCSSCVAEPLPCAKCHGTRQLQDLPCSTDKEHGNIQKKNTAKN